MNVNNKAVGVVVVQMVIHANHQCLVQVSFLCCLCAALYANAKSRLFLVDVIPFNGLDASYILFSEYPVQVCLCQPALKWLQIVTWFSIWRKVVAHILWKIGNDGF